jgi:endo-1,4-beta-xylanase
VILHRRHALLSALALAACGRSASAGAGADIPPLKTAAPFPVGVAAMAGFFDDLGWSELVRSQFDRVTPEWEMKTEAVLDGAGGFDFARPDRLVEAARERGLGVFGHTLVWYAQSHPALEALAGDRPAFADRYRTYVQTLARRWRVAGWDVVNEPVADDGSLRDCLWRRTLGDDYIRLAFEHAREAAPGTPLFLNDYDLESRPEKLAGYLRLVERLLKAGAPLGGLGTQTHVAADLPRGRIAATVRELGRFGLPVHVSELDVSLNRAGLAALRGPALLEAQAALVAETVEAVMALPEGQRFGITVWGARDRDSWLRRGGEAKAHMTQDQPLLFDDEGRPKGGARRFVGALRATAP